MKNDEEMIEQFHRKVGFIPWKSLEEFILKNQHIWRPLRGHCFETWFDNLIISNGYTIKPVGGDDTTDRILNGKKLQLKTPYQNGTIKGKRVAFALHKTHGLEKRPHNLYRPNNFADFLVGLHPDGSLIICPRKSIPLNKDYPRRSWPDYLADPVYFPWNTEWKNRFELLGIKIKEPPKITSQNNKLFPRIGELTGLSDVDIIKTLLAPENFRVLEQNLMGTIREWHFIKASEKEGIKLIEPDKNHSTRIRIKVDFILPNGKTIQVKGRTKSLCKGNIIGVEVKGSHGRIPQRLYRKGDFDFLVVVLDPNSIPPEFAKANKLNRQEYNFVIIPTRDLRIHERSREWGREYWKDIHKFNLADYKINDFSLLKETQNKKRSPLFLLVL